MCIKDFYQATLARGTPATADGSWHSKCATVRAPLLRLLPQQPDSRKAAQEEEEKDVVCDVFGRRWTCLLYERSNDSSFIHFLNLLVPELMVVGSIYLSIYLSYGIAIRPESHLIALDRFCPPPTRQCFNPSSVVSTIFLV